jgi:hypothetical protein
MKSFLSRLSHVFAAGCFGGLVHTLIMWLCGHYHLTYLLGVRLSTSFSFHSLYPRIVWGGIWGFFFLLPLRGGSTLKNGVLLSLAPTLIQLFVVFPYKAHKGFLGMELGTLTPVFVLVVNFSWGIAAALWLKASRG